MQAIISNSTDPAFNLALEECLFQSLQAADCGFFLLWRDAPSIIVGRHQNTAEEINEQLVHELALPVVRRMTGGGAVYHDVGNLNFSFLLPKKGQSNIDFACFMSPILLALQELGVKAEFSSRNDITVNGRKISGSAQRLSALGVLHHGTILFDLDLDFLTKILAGAPDKFLSKGIASIRDRVANLKEFVPATITMQDLEQVLVKHCATEIVDVPTNLLAEATVLAASKYSKYDWNYGASPPFTESRKKRFSCGLIDLRFEVVRGKIKSCRFYGDFFSSADIAILEQSFCNLPRTSEAFIQNLQNHNLSSYFSGCNVDEMVKFIVFGDV